MEYVKVYVEVTAQFHREGGLRPLSLRWSDGRIFEIERVEEMARSPARVDGLLPVRYTCLVLGQRRYLYFEPDKLRWFVEVRI